MPFATGDQKRIAKILRLTQEQYFPSSMLKSLMDSLEATDTEQSTTFVSDIKLALDQIDALDEEIDTSAEADGIASKSISGQYSVTYQNAGAATAVSKAKKKAFIDDIKLWLDPNNQLDAFSTVSRVIMTL